MFQDKSVREDVIRELDWEPVIRSTEIGVGVKDGIVTLSGVVTAMPPNELRSGRWHAFVVCGR